ncbi:MAG: cation transporter, partial [Clostridia bacterium]|nr:cation transporter [Clostridia bacterium]
MDEKKTVDRVSRVGIFGNILLSAFKLAAGILGSSGAMVSDAVHSLSDVFATFIAWIGVRLSRREEDKAHPYGHERLECVASLLLGLILAGTGAAIGYGGIQKLLAGEENIAVPTVLPLIAAIVSIAVKEGMYHYTMHYAKLLGSDAFRADAWHHRSDAISSVGSFIGIGLAKLGIRIADPIASLLICVLILKVAFDIIRDSIRKMLDTSCSAEFEEKLRSFVAAQEGV